MKYSTSSQERQGLRRMAAMACALFLVMLGAALFSGSFFRLNALKDGEVFDASTASAQSEMAVPVASETETGTPGATGTTTGTPGSTGTTTPGSTGTTTPGSTGTTTPGSTGTTTPGSTGTTTPGSTGTTTPGSTGTTTPGSTGTTTPGATGTTTGTPGPGCTATSNVPVSIVSGGFNPSTVNVDVATSVTWTNNSGSRARIRDINHVLFDSGDIQAGGSWTYTFCINGSFQYENSRGSGIGWVIVGTGGSTTTPNPSTTTTPGTPGSTGTTTPGSTGTTTPGSTGTTTPGSTTTSTTSTPGSTTTAGSTTTRTRTPETTETTTPGSTTTTTTSTPGSTGTSTPGSTGTGTPGSTTTLTPGSTTTPSSCATGFSDVEAGSTFYEFVQCLTCRSIIGGYPDGTFRPNSSITRGQIAKIVSNAAGYSDTPTGQTFSDVAVDDTFYVFVERAVMHGVLGGYSDGTFRPGNNATRGQIAKIVANAAGYEDAVAGQNFADVAVGSTFFDYVERLAVRSIMSGYACGGAGEPCGSGNLPYFRPSNDATRGQVTKIVSNTFFPNCQP